jgi:serine/threonine protein kinase
LEKEKLKKTINRILLDNKTYKSEEDDIRVRFKITKKLGEGGFAQVKHAKNRITN